MYKSRSKLMMLAKDPSQDGGDLRPGRRQPVTPPDNAIGPKIGPCFGSGTGNTELRLQSRAITIGSYQSPR
ncbi:zinc metalloproteinase [Aspergillus luchuensis]|uniref:Zinc metalloproteinase n=1 Tax=Aspergillus kawachii TaxID=1069201 RepID=A0A146FYX8_ASPKA|nr:zinc metalloproteinase [Aspergillus luchuensis]